MGRSHLRVARPDDFHDYRGKVRKTAEEDDPEVSVGKWEQEDVNFEDEYILDRPPFA